MPSESPCVQSGQILRWRERTAIKLESNAMLHWGKVGDMHTGDGFAIIDRQQSTMSTMDPCCSREI